MPKPQLPLTSVDGQSQQVLALYGTEAEALEAIKQQILAELADLSKGKLIYDAHFPWWAKHIFGDVSYAHEVVKKALRAASLVKAGVTGDVAANEHTDALDDDLSDLLNFVVMWMSWRRYQREASIAQPQESEEEVEDEDLSHRARVEY